MTGTSSNIITVKSRGGNMHLLDRTRAHILFISTIIILSLFWVGSASFASQGALVGVAAAGNVEEVKRLLASEKVSSDELVDALDQAVEGGHADMVRVLLDAGIDLKRMRRGWRCPLTTACREGRIDIVKLLLDKGVSANDGSALAAAAGGSYLPGHGGGHLDIVKLLVERGADVNAESDDCLDPSGDFSVTALQVAAREGHLEVVRYLLEKGADVNAADNEGDTPLFYALPNAALVKLLIEKGADPNIKNGEGLTVLDIAERENLPEIIAILRGGRSKEVPKLEAK